MLLPCLFNLYAEYIMRNAGLDETQAGIKIAGRNINNLRYEDDTTLMAESGQELKVMSDSLQPHGLRHARPPCPSPTPGVYSNSRPLRQWCHPTIASSVGPFSSHLQSFPASGSFTVSQFFAWGGQSTGVSGSASILPVNVQDWFPLGLTGWISL